MGAKSGSGQSPKILERHQWWCRESWVYMGIRDGGEEEMGMRRGRGSAG